MFGNDRFSVPPFFLGACFFLFCFTGSQAQQAGSDQRRTASAQTLDTLKQDTTKVADVAALDIGENRGLFITTPDQKMQMRILGSVRFLVVADQLDLPSKDAFSTYEIQTGEQNVPLPNYYNGLNQTRLGFEVTRRTDKGDVFIRLETDFAGTNGFRIRHAYGQFKSFLFGQTWSLFSHVNASPAVVDFGGPTGSVVTRNPQLRYSKANIINGYDLAVGLEYVIPNLAIPDSIQARTFQLIPAVTARLNKEFPWGSFQLSGILPTVSGRDLDDNLLLKAGWGLSSSAVINSWKHGKWYLQGVLGREITRYFTDLTNQGLDLAISPEGNIKSPLVVGFYATYEHYWKTNLYSNFTYGRVHLEKFDFTEETRFLKGGTFRVNTFWDLAEGATIGLEGVWGKRVDVNDLTGDALRASLLFYYDF